MRFEIVYETEDGESHFPTEYKKPGWYWVGSNGAAYGPYRTEHECRQNAETHIGD